MPLGQFTFLPPGLLRKEDKVKNYKCSSERGRRGWDDELEDGPDGWRTWREWTSKWNRGSGEERHQLHGDPRPLQRSPGFVRECWGVEGDFQVGGRDTLDPFAHCTQRGFEVPRIDVAS